MPGNLHWIWGGPSWAVALTAGLLSGGAAMAQAASDGAAVAVTVGNFVRAETDGYFPSAVNDGAFGKLAHRRAVANIDKQDVVRMNRDTLYSSGVFDLDAGPVTITLPDSGKRFMSMLTLSEDHYVVDVVYAPGTYVYAKDKVGTRYLYVIVRTLADAESADGHRSRKRDAGRDQGRTGQSRRVRGAELGPRQPGQSAGGAERARRTSRNEQRRNVRNERRSRSGRASDRNGGRLGRQSAVRGDLSRRLSEAQRRRDSLHA